MRAMSRRLPAAITSLLMLTGLVALPAPAALAGFSVCVVTNARTLATTPDLATAIADATAGDTLKIQSVCEGGMTINKRLTLVGVPGVDAPRIDGKRTQRTLTIAAGKTVTLRGLGIIGGAVDGDRTTGAGGGILNLGTLTLKNVNVDGNIAAYGGGIANRGTLTLSGTTLVGHNTATQGGGLESSGTLILQDAAVVEANEASIGGGIALARMVSNAPAPVLELHDAAVIRDNVSGSGAGIAVLGGIVRMDGTASLVNNNASNGGGGVWMDGGKLTLGGRAAIKRNIGGYAGGIGTSASGVSRIFLGGKSLLKANRGGGASAIYLIGQLTMSGSAAIRGHDQPTDLATVMIDRAPSTTSFLHMTDDSRITANTAQVNGAAVGTLVCVSGDRPELKGTKGRVVGNTPKNVLKFTNAVC